MPRICKSRKSMFSVMAHNNIWGPCVVVSPAKSVGTGQVKKAKQANAK